MAKSFLIVAGISGLFAVAIGAFGAHGLKDKIDSSLLAAYHTGVQYHFYHTLALALVAVLLIRFPGSSLLIASGWAFFIGIVLFSGSLYGLALGAPRWFGPITPLGGLSFMIGWILWVVGAWRLNELV
ncbi:MAG: DUF423 domain-containing protein [Cellvibrionaceae bacterium]